MKGLDVVAGAREAWCVALLPIAVGVDPGVEHVLLKIGLSGVLATKELDALFENGLTGRQLNAHQVGADGFSRLFLDALQPERKKG